MSCTPAVLPPRTRAIVAPDGSFRNPWATFEERTFIDVMKWKVTNNHAPPFPSPEEAKRLLPSTEPNWSVIRRYTTPSNDADATAASSVPLSPPPRRSPLAHHLPRVEPSVDLADDMRSGKLSVTWCSHSAFLVQCAGFTVLTDPVWSDYASPVQFAGPKRMVPVPLALDALPKIDVVTISHNHYDHLDTATVKALFKQWDPLFVVPLGMKQWFASFRCGMRFHLDRVVELDWWHEVVVGKGCNGMAEIRQAPQELPTSASDAHSSFHAHRNDDASLVRIAATPVQHWSMRSGFDRYKELWCGFAVRFGVVRLNAPNGYLQRCVFHCGDTGYCSEFRNIGDHFAALDSCSQPEKNPDEGEQQFDTTSVKFAVDVALLPIGAYLPRDVMQPQHVNPDDAVMIFDDIRAKYAIGMHWGTFILTDEAVDQPPKDLDAAMKARSSRQTPSTFAIRSHQRRRETQFVAIKHGETRIFEDADLD